MLILRNFFITELFKKKFNKNILQRTYIKTSCDRTTLVQHLAGKMSR